MEIILSRVGAGFYPARFAAPSQLSPVGRHPCVPPLDTRCIPNGGAHWLRPTVVLPTPHPMSRTAPSNPVIARSGATWQSVLLLHRISDLCVGAGFYPRSIRRPLPVIPCRAAPMCAAARHALHPQRRGTLAPPYRHFTNSIGNDAHIVPSARHPQ